MEEEVEEEDPAEVRRRREREELAMASLPFLSAVWMGWILRPYFKSV